MRIVNPVAIVGENLAADYLRKKGYKIIERNFRLRNGEIDIIAIHKNTLVFIEVKTRKSITFGTPLEAITHRKINEIIKTAQLYKSINENLPDLLRIDAISISLKPDNKIDMIKHVENISL